MHGEVVDALLRLLDERVAIDLPRQILGTSADFLERLIDRNGADRHGGIAEDPLARLVDVSTRREIHHRVRAPERGPSQLVDFLLDRRADGGVPDVRVDLHGEVPADDHRLELGVVDVRGDDGAPPRNLRADELGIEPLADRDELHLRRHDSAARVVELRHRTGAAARCHHALAQSRGHARASRSGRSRRSRSFDDIPARHDPVAPQLRETVSDVVSLRSARVVHPERRLPAAERNLTHRDPSAAGLDVHLARIRKCRGKVGCLQGRKRRTNRHWEPRDIGQKPGTPNQNQNPEP